VNAKPPKPSRAPPEGADTLSLTRAAEYLIEECRMVLPGLQALFGFQLIAVFSARFDALLHAEKLLHLGAIALVATAIALIMTPAAYHRLTQPGLITGHFIRLSSGLLMASMPLLMAALCLDFYIVARVVAGPGPALLLASGVFAIFVLLWIVLPLVSRILRLDRTR